MSEHLTFANKESRRAFTLRPVLLDAPRRPEFKPAMPELICPELPQPLHASGSFVSKRELQLNTFDDIRTILIDLTNQDELKLKDSRVKDHVNRVLSMSRGIAEALGNEIEVFSRIPTDIALVIVVIGAINHDGGKNKWGEELLDLNAKITREQFEEFVKPHPLDSAEMIRNAAEKRGVTDHWAVKEVINIALGHHLKWNPEKCSKVGYPENVGRQTFLTSIVSVADAFDAMLFRPYSPKFLNLQACFDEVIACMQTGEFNDQLHAGFCKWYADKRADLQEQCDRMQSEMPKLLEREVGSPYQNLRRAA